MLSPLDDVAAGRMAQTVYGVCPGTQKKFHAKEI
jgi:hypothetical protein